MTTTKENPPIFSGDAATMESEFHKLVTGDTIDFKGQERETDGEKTSMLEIRITNASRLPNDAQAQKMLARSVAAVLKNGLKDKEQYDTIDVVFVTRTQNSLGSASQSVSHEFKAESL